MTPLLYDGAITFLAALPVDDADTFQKWLLEEFDDKGDTVMFAPGDVQILNTGSKAQLYTQLAVALREARQ